MCRRGRREEEGKGRDGTGAIKGRENSCSFVYAQIADNERRQRWPRCMQQIRCEAAKLHFYLFLLGENADAGSDRCCRRGGRNFLPPASTNSCNNKKKKTTDLALCRGCAGLCLDATRKAGKTPWLPQLQQLCDCVCVCLCVCLACCLWAGSMNCRHLSALRSWQRCRRWQSDNERATILFLLIFLAHPSLDLLPDLTLAPRCCCCCRRCLLHGMAGVVCAGVAFKGFGLFRDNNNSNNNATTTTCRESSGGFRFHLAFRSAWGNVNISSSSSHNRLCLCACVCLCVSMCVFVSLLGIALAPDRARPYSLSTLLPHSVSLFFAGMRRLFTQLASRVAYSDLLLLSVLCSFPLCFCHFAVDLALFIRFPLPPSPIMDRRRRRWPLLKDFSRNRRCGEISTFSC